MALNIYADVGERIKKAVEVALTDTLNEALPPRGTPISQRQAAAKYGVSMSTIGRWAKKGWVKVLDHGEGPRSIKLLDEHEIAYILVTNDVTQGSWTQPPNGHPPLHLVVRSLSDSDLPSEGTPISVTLASQKYGISRQTIYDWVRKEKIAVLNAEHAQYNSKLLVDERDVLVLAHSSRGNQGKSKNQ